VNGSTDDGDDNASDNAKGARKDAHPGLQTKPARRPSPRKFWKCGWLAMALSWRSRRPDSAAVSLALGRVALGPDR